MINFLKMVKLVLKRFFDYIYNLVERKGKEYEDFFREKTNFKYKNKLLKIKNEDNDYQFVRDVKLIREKIKNKEETRIDKLSNFVKELEIKLKYCYRCLKMQKTPMLNDDIMYKIDLIDSSIVIMNFNESMKESEGEIIKDKELILAINKAIGDLDRRVQGEIKKNNL